MASVLSQIQHHAGLLVPGAHPQTHLPADLLPPSGAGPRGQQRAGECAQAQGGAGNSRPGGAVQSGLTIPVSPSLRAMPTCPAAAASRRRALASSWPAVSRGMLPSPCCSLTTTSSAEVTPGGHCLSPPPSFNSSVDGAPQRRHRLCLSGHFNSPALKLRNVGPMRYQRTHFQGLGHHCQSGAGAEPLPSLCSQRCGCTCSLCQLGEPPAHPLNLVPFPGTPSIPSPVSMEMDWFRTYDIPRNCHSTEKTRLLGLRVEGALSN